MEISEILKSYPNVNLTVRAEDLTEMVRFTVSETIKHQSVEKQVIKKLETDDEKYLTAKEAALKLGVVLSTLWRYNKNGNLKPIKIGGKRAYRMSDINKILEGK